MNSTFSKAVFQEEVYSIPLVHNWKWFIIACCTRSWNISRSLSVDLRCRWCVFEGFEIISEMYSGVKLFKDLYTQIHVWYWTPFWIGSQLRMLNIWMDSVLNSAWRIILAALFWSFSNLSIYYCLSNDPKQDLHGQTKAIYLG